MNNATTKILYQVNLKTVHKILSLLENFPRNLESFSEEVLVKLYKYCKHEDKNTFLSRFLKNGQSLENLSLPLDVDIF